MGEGSLKEEEETSGEEGGKSSKGLDSDDESNPTFSPTSRLSLPIVHPRAFEGQETLTSDAFTMYTIPSDLESVTSDDDASASSSRDEDSSSDDSECDDLQQEMKEKRRLNLKNTLNFYEITGHRLKDM